MDIHRPPPPRVRPHRIKGTYIYTSWQDLFKTAWGMMYSNAAGHIMVGNQCTLSGVTIFVVNIIIFACIIIAALPMMCASAIILHSWQAGNNSKCTVQQQQGHLWNRRSSSHHRRLVVSDSYHWSRIKGGLQYLTSHSAKAVSQKESDKRESLPGFAVQWG